MTSISILGAGSWGTALAQTFAINFDQVVLWTHSESQAKELKQSHTNPRYLEGISLAKNIVPTADLDEASKSSIIVFVVPTKATREVSEKLGQCPSLNQNAVLVSCAKGIERGSGKRMSEIIAELIPGHPVAVLSGPNHAEEVAKQLPAAAVIGCSDVDLARELQHKLSAPRFRLYCSDDIAGIELGAAIKNVFAIAAGISDGLGLGDNATAALVTRGLAEMARLGPALGGQPETFVGLSGVGDLMVTCYSHHSRNNRVGRALGQGGKLDEIVEGLGMVAEGVPNTLSIYEQAQKAGVRTPLIDAVYSVLYEDKVPAQALEELFTRELKHEQD